ncbi:hypothetical protein MSAN_02300600 [Mycena sanguinolenta]|uniref:Uncharacterized protein n=1 Tax=Mycena sanguinolenta TaxID=230812 RepID=A0A8H6X948_9AGAR|nr:hypothetical protein MSAN_02300600 [Mycena sanguinolenta]
MIRCLNICLTILCVIVFGPLIIVGMDFILETVANTVAAQKKLRSLITADTLISGFYGPGSWWAWLITLGMTHAHSLVATAEPDEWDYDLVAASGYTITAAIDLTLKARTIEKLGASACESPLLPAMLCAERAVWVGTGSSFFTIATAIYIGGPAHRRRAAIAIIPLLIASIVSWFALGAHRTIFPTNVNLRCRLVDGGMMEPEDIYFTFVDFPASMIDILILNILPDVYTSRIHWLVAAGLTVPLTGIISLVDGGLSWTAFRRALAGAVLFSLHYSGLLCFHGHNHLEHSLGHVLATGLYSRIFAEARIFSINRNVCHGHGPAGGITWRWVYRGISQWKTDSQSRA